MKIKVLEDLSEAETLGLILELRDRGVTEDYYRTLVYSYDDYEAGKARQTEYDALVKLNRETKQWQLI